jgi:hypothetical protein
LNEIFQLGAKHWYQFLNDFCRFFICGGRSFAALEVDLNRFNLKEAKMAQQNIESHQQFRSMSDSKLPTFLMGLVLGVSAAYLFDLNQGRRRRASRGLRARGVARMRCAMRPQ